MVSEISLIFRQKHYSRLELLINPVDRNTHTHQSCSTSCIVYTFGMQASSLSVHTTVCFVIFPPEISYSWKHWVDKAMLYLQSQEKLNLLLTNRLTP